jgi:3-oxoacid CoA-transferase B subunit
LNVEKKPLSRQQMADRIAREFQDGWIVNLGIGIPTLCSNYKDPNKTIIYQSENGLIGYGGIYPKGEENLYIVNAGGQYVSLIPGAAIVHHADSFSLIRSGRLDATVMGSYEVAENGDFANWKTLGRKGGGIGGAMDLAVGAKRVFMALQHTTKEGEPRLRKRCTLPVTAVGVVKLVVTDLGFFELTDAGFLMKEIAPGYEPEEVQSMTEAKLKISPKLKVIEV